jgi:hypothetical protein
MLISTQQSCTPSSTCAFIFYRRGEPYSLHHSATISYHFDKIFTPNALEMTLLSNDVKLHAYLSDYEILTDDRQNDCALHTDIDMELKWGEFDVLCHQT